MIYFFSGDLGFWNPKLVSARRTARERAVSRPGSPIPSTRYLGWEIGGMPKLPTRTIQRIEATSGLEFIGYRELRREAVAIFGTRHPRIVDSLPYTGPELHSRPRSSLKKQLPRCLRRNSHRPHWGRHQCESDCFGLIRGESALIRVCSRSETTTVHGTWRESGTLHNTKWMGRVGRRMTRRKSGLEKASR
jgi:hypothetical protein